MAHKFNVIVKAKFIFLLYKFINFNLFILTKILWPKKINKNSKKICIYRVGNIGDMLCTIPAIIAIRNAYPNAHITLLTSPGKKGAPGAKELLDGAWFIDKLWVYYSSDIHTLKNKYQLIKKLKKESFDLWINLPLELSKLRTVLRNIFFAKFCRAKHACGFVISTIKLWAHEQSEIHQFDNEVERLIKVLKRSKLPVNGKVSYELPVPSDVQKSASGLISQYQIKNNHLFGLVPGAKYRANQWPLDNFVEIGRFILQKYPETKIAIFGGMEDYEKGKYIKDKIGDPSVINLCGKTSLLEVAFILKYTRTVLSNNTGILHLAALGGTNVIGIFSAAELNGKWFPYGKQCKILMKRVECEGCYYKCPNHYMCINAIKPKDVKGLLDFS